MGFFGLFSLVAMGVASIQEEKRRCDFDDKMRATAIARKDRLGTYIDHKGAHRDIKTDERVDVKFIDNEPIIYDSYGRVLRNIAIDEVKPRIEEERKKIAEGKSHRTYIPLIPEYGYYSSKAGSRKYVDIETEKIYYVRSVRVKRKYMFKTFPGNRESTMTMGFLYNPITKKLVRPTDDTILEYCLQSLKYPTCYGINGKSFSPKEFVDFVKKEIIPKVVEDDKKENFIINGASHYKDYLPSRDDFLNRLEEYKQEQREIEELWQKRSELIEYKKQNGIPTYWRDLLPEDYELKYKHERIVY